MHHHVRGVKHVIPVRDMLDIDEVNYAAVDKSIEDITGTTTDKKTEANKFVAPHRISIPQIGNYGA